MNRKQVKNGFISKKGGTVRALLVTFIFFLLMVVTVDAAQHPDTDTIPKNLEPWKPWVLHGEEERFCPTFYNDSDAYICTWPSDLDLDIHGKGGRFVQRWFLFVKGWVPLPGGHGEWPRQVFVDGRPVPVILKGKNPSVHLTPGEHLVKGSFIWDEMPETIHVPEATGLVSLSIEGRVVDSPLLDKEGRLWLRKVRQVRDQEDRLEISVYRLLNDTIPMRATAHFKINVSGRAREIKLEGALLEKFIPLEIRSPIPARLDSDGRLVIQARPGRWEVRVLARSKGPVNKITLLQMPYGEEIWSFSSQNRLRMVKVGGVPSIDPARTDIPSEWKGFPAFIVKAGQKMTFRELRRGDPDPAPDQLRLDRTMWLDFDGNGLTVRDSIKGTMSRQWFLAMARPGILGRVSVDGTDRLITAHGPDSKPGVELRRGHLDLVAESRLEQPSTLIPAVGWDHDFQSVSGYLNLPPGWRLLTASGVDNMPGTWLLRWTLLDLFLVLIISLATCRLWNWKWGILALVAVGLAYHEPGAPRLVWLHLLVAAALLRFLPRGWFRRAVNFWRLGSLVALLVIAIPFMVNQVRWGLYPQLEPYVSATRAAGEGYKGYVGRTFKDAEMPAAQSGKKTADGVGSYMKSKLVRVTPGYPQKQTLMIQDPNALIQTGPGLPDWRWHSFNMKWNGPVERSQKVRLWLLSPTVNLVLAFLRVFFLALLIFMMADFRKWKTPKDNFAFTTMLACMLILALGVKGEVMAQGYPSDSILKELKERLLEKPDCFPNCAVSPRMELAVDSDNVKIAFHVHAAVETAVPLPGSLESWRPIRVLLDSSPAQGLIRDSEGSLWIFVPGGMHTVTLTGDASPGNTFQIPLPLRPERLFVESKAWDVKGVGEEGRVKGTIKLTRIAKNREGVSGEVLVSLKPFFSIERILSLGLDWQIATTVKRVSRPGTPAVISVPLIEGESVTTSGIVVKNRQALVNIEPKEREIVWHSILKKVNMIKLKAPDTLSWTETWILDVSPVWHCEFEGLTVLHHQDSSGQWRPEWRPWPGEEVVIKVSKPSPVSGQIVTIDSSELRLTPGRRFSKAQLSLDVRTSRGGQHKIVMPENARLQSVKIMGRTQPVREQGRDLIVPLRPGSQKIDIEWHQGVSSAFFTGGPDVRIGESAVNADVIFQMPRDRWILMTGGPYLGPAVLYWSYFLVIIIAAVGLGRVSLTPLKTRHWLLLGLGLTQVHPVVAVMIAGWFVALGLRRERRFDKGWFSFDFTQVLLAVWTLAVLVGLYIAIQKGLLGIPNMQISGNGSSDFWLHWTQDRIGPVMPKPWVLSLPLFVFRILMLLWALWLAYFLLKWLRWAWDCFSEGGLWRKVSRSKGKENESAQDSVAGGTV